MAAMSRNSQNMTSDRVQRIGDVYSYESSCPKKGDE